MTERSPHVQPQAHDHTHHHAHGHAHAAPARAAVARVPVDAEPVSWLMHSGAQRLLAALLVIAAVLAAMAWAMSGQG